MTTQHTAVPRRTRGSTLIEMMIAVAILGIALGTAGTAATQDRLAGQHVLAQERAAQLLEYHATCLARGTAVDPVVSAALTEGLPGARVETKRAGATATVTLRWHEGGLAHEQALAVFARGAP